MAPTGDLFNLATDLDINGIDDLEKSVEHGVMLFMKKINCLTMIKYGGQVLDTTGAELVVRADPEKFEGLRAFPSPDDPADIQSLIGGIKKFDRWIVNIST